MLAKIEGNAITVMTRATPTVLALLPTLEGRRNWLKGGGLRVENTPHNLDALKTGLPDLTVEGQESTELFDHQPAPVVPFAFKRQPDHHQLTALERMKQHKHFGLFMEQGTGKTKVAIDRSSQLHLSGEIDALLVLTKKGVHRQWVESELPKDCSTEYLADWWKGKPVPEELLVGGGPLKVWSMNWDALRGEKAFAEVFKFCQAHRGRLHIVADESQCIMTHTSIRHRKACTLKLFASHRSLLTGTPVAKDLTDEWAQLKWLDESILGVRYITTFRAQYCIMGGYEGRVVVGHKNMTDFRSKVDPFTYRVTKAQIGYIPKRHSEWVFDLTADQKRLIKQVKQELLAELNSGEVIPISSATAAFTKVQQITNGFIIGEDGKPVQLMPAVKNPRLIATNEWLAANDGKAIIWTRFIADRQLVAFALNEAGIEFTEYTGTDDERYRAKMDFIQQADKRVFLANPQSAGTGTDGLQEVCTQALYYSNSFNAIDRWQSEDRIDRRGMIGGARYTDLIAKGSIDRYILGNLRRKKGISNLSLGDVERAFDNV